ncbi:hypothetical protein DFH06DRAFT_1479594 [Mycena polygramma]|nr:hypothetical protein DFH06DRAFT_1479594 [Mycena polygramma]
MADVFMVLIAVAVGVFTTILSLALTFGITMPFVGVLVRYRANYVPKGGAVRLDDEAGPGAALISDSSLSYFGMMKRVHRIEGWAGLYKGLMPSITASLLIAVLFVPVTVVLGMGHRAVPHGGVHLAPQAGPHFWTITFAASILPVLLLIPAQIIINRAITTPHKLAAFEPRTALRILLSPAERAQPLRLYLAPGVALALLLEGLIAPALSLLHQAARPLPRGAFLGGTLPVVLVATALLTPLEVMLARLTLQRRGPEPAATNDAAPVYTATDSVMDFRTESGAVPYTGLVDCARKIVAEEGWVVLTRAWWLTAFGMLLSVGALVAVPPRV